MTTPGTFEYATGWFVVYVDKKGIIRRAGPFDTQEQANRQFLKIMLDK